LTDDDQLTQTANLIPPAKRGGKLSCAMCKLILSAVLLHNKSKFFHFFTNFSKIYQPFKKLKKTSKKSKKFKKIKKSKKSKKSKKIKKS
jgi:hypothetical protein